MAVSSSREARQIAFALDVKSAEIFENCLLNNGCLAKMALNKRIKIRQGGNKFDERIHLGQNSNVNTRSRFAPIPLDFQNNWYTAEYGQAVMSGAAIVNLVEIDQAQGPHQLDDIAEKSIEECQKTFPNKMADCLMASSPASTDPESIVNVIEATAYGSQTSTTGGITRSSHPGTTADDAWQNQYRATAITDMGAVTGIAALSKFFWTCSPGGSGLNEQPDIALTTTGVLAKTTGGGDVLRRFNADLKMLEYGFDNVIINRAAMIADRNVSAGYCYAMNSNYLRLQVLAGPNTKTYGDVQAIGDGKISVPMQVRPSIEADDHLNISIKVYIVFNLTFGGLRQHGLQVSITEA